MIARRLILNALPLFAALSFGHASADTLNVTQNIARRPELSVAYELIVKAGLQNDLNQSAVTVFIPTNEAFGKLKPADREKITTDANVLKATLKYHVIKGRQTAAAAPTGLVDTLNGAKLEISRAGDFLTLNEALVVTPDLDAGQSVVHVIDSVLVPATKK